MSNENQINIEEYSRIGNTMERLIENWLDNEATVEQRHEFIGRTMSFALAEKLAVTMDIKNRLAPGEFWTRLFVQCAEEVTYRRYKAMNGYNGD